MKGIAECIKWLTDNEGMELECEIAKEIRSKYKDGVFYYKTYDSDYKIDSNFNSFINFEWKPTELREEVTWQEAIQAWIEGEKVYYISKYWATPIYLIDSDNFGILLGSDDLKWYVE